MSKEWGGNTRQKLGEMLVEYNLIYQSELHEALKIQSQRGGHIGSILLELGYLSIDNLLKFLGKQFGVKSINLHQLTIEPSILNLLPFETMLKYGVLPVSVGTRGVTVAMVNPNNLPAINDLQFMLGRAIHPVIVPFYQMTAALKLIEEAGGTLVQPLIGTDLEHVYALSATDRTLSSLEELLEKLVKEKGSDLLLTAGVAPCLKKDNMVIRLPRPALTPGQVNEYALELMNPTQREEFMQSNELDFSFTLNALGRFRVSIYKQRNSVSISLRRIFEHVPSPKDLGLPEDMAEFALKSKGLILITGPEGHGKTTTLASLVDVINTRRKCNILTIEDPIEYLHRHKSSNVNQREVGVDTSSFHEGLRRIFRQAADVIVIGEMRDPESFEIALQASETGHLVMSTLHSSSATSTIDRIIDVFPPQRQQQIKIQLAENLLVILNQRLVPRKKGQGRVLAVERLVNSLRIKNLIREGKSHQIKTMIQQSAEDFQSLDGSLAQLCIAGKITVENAMEYCDNQTTLKNLVANAGAAKQYP